MAFLNVRGQSTPVVNYYYDTSVSTNTRPIFTAWQFAAVFALLVIATIMFFVRTVNANLQLVSAESVTPSLSAPSQTPSPVPVSAPAVVSVPQPQSDALQADVDAWIAAHKGVDWGVSVASVSGDTLAEVNSEKVFTLASVYKLFLLQPLAHKLPSDQWATTSINGKTYAKCVDAMIRVSDNVCAEAIGSKLGWTNAQKYLRTVGYAKTSFTGDVTTGTAKETSLLLKNLYSGEGFDELTRSSAMQAMVAPKKVEGIRRGCDGCTVYNKTGDLAGYHNDAAIIEKNGKAYSVVIFSKTASWPQIAELTKVISKHF